VSTDRAGARARACVICHETIMMCSWVTSWPVCPGNCYKTAVTQALAARRPQPASVGYGPVTDRTPIAMTTDLAEHGDGFIRTGSRPVADAEHRRRLRRRALQTAARNTPPDAAPIGGGYLPSPDVIDRARSAAGGWTRPTLAAWGVPWPPPPGWRAELQRRWTQQQQPEQ
jgi:hypothetical protein